VVRDWCWGAGGLGTSCVADLPFVKGVCSGVSESCGRAGGGVRWVGVCVLTVVGCRVGVG
jgi:hypothetical protein